MRVLDDGVGDGAGHEALEPRQRPRRGHGRAALTPTRVSEVMQCFCRAHFAAVSEIGRRADTAKDESETEARLRRSCTLAKGSAEKKQICIEYIP